jgi:hypothetical protein
MAPEEPPDPELPENKDPFQQSIRIGDTGVADLVAGLIVANRLGQQPNQGHEKKGLISLA